MKKSLLPKKNEPTLIITPEQQLAELRKQLTGHKVFVRCRGCFGELPYDEWLDKQVFTNPSTMLNNFDRWAADQRIMLNMIAALARDGKDAALKELLKALTSNHVIICFRKDKQ
jgi:hypothetical protein